MVKPLAPAGTAGIGGAAQRCRKAMEAKAGTPESPQKNGKMFFSQAFVKKQKCRKKEIKIFTKNSMPNKEYQSHCIDAETSSA